MAAGPYAEALRADRTNQRTALTKWSTRPNSHESTTPSTTLLNDGQALRWRLQNVASAPAAGVFMPLVGFGMRSGERLVLLLSEGRQRLARFARRLRFLHDFSAKRERVLGES